MNSTLYVKRFENSVGCDVTEDFSLPDYQPEIRRVIGVRASASADGKYLSGDELEADGGVTYTVLYVGADGAICQTSQTSSFTGHIPLASDDEDRYSAADLILSCSADNVVCRVTAPRKITLSSKVRLGLLSQKPHDVSLKTEAPSGTEVPAVRRKTAQFPSVSMCEIRQTGETGGEIRERAGMKVVFAWGEVCVSDVRVDRSRGCRAFVKGDGYMTALMFDPDGGYVTVRARAPIEEEIPLPDMPADSLAKAAVFPNVVMLEVESGDDGAVEWHLEYDLDCDVMKCVESEITTDAYLPDSEEKLTVSTLRAYAPGGAVNGRLTTSASMKIGGDMSYVCSWGSGMIDRCEVSGGRMIMNGSAKITVVKTGGGEVSAEDVMIPLRYECEAIDGAADSDDGGLAKRTKVGVTDISVRKDGDSLGITAELAITAATLEEKTVSCATEITSVRVDDRMKKKNVIRVYVPDKDETEWDVEKKFRLGREAKPEGAVYVIR